MTNIYKLKQNPYMFSKLCVKLPELLEQNLKYIFANYSFNPLNHKGEILSMVRHIDQRQAPLEKEEFNAKVLDIKSKLNNSKGKHAAPHDGPDARMKRKIIGKLREGYHWTPSSFEERNALLYTAGKIASNFAVLYQIFNEIKLRRPDFKPESILDFGCGVGSVSWASQTCWNSSLRSHYCVDNNRFMRNLAREIIEGTHPHSPAILGTVFKETLPGLNFPQRDLVVSAHSLMDMPGKKWRLMLLDHLLTHARSYLVRYQGASSIVLNTKVNRFKRIAESVFGRVRLGNTLTHFNSLFNNPEETSIDLEVDKGLILVEHGTTSSYRLIMEARDYILQKGIKMKETHGNLLPNGVTPSIFSPCTHNLNCPRLSSSILSATPCSYNVRYYPLKLMEPTIDNVFKESYSYVVFEFDKDQSAKVDFTPLPKDDTIVADKWSRIVAPPLIRSRHVHCQLCSPCGTLQHQIVTKFKNGRDLYHSAKRSLTGDMFPTPSKTPGPQTLDGCKDALGADDECIEQNVIDTDELRSYS